MEQIDHLFGIIVWIASALLSYKAIYLVVGFFLPAKKFKPSTHQYTYAILVSARNEEQTIAQLLDSIKKQDYPQDKLSIFVVAHNCTDSTAEKARAAGATVYEYNNPNERRKGYALKYLLEQIRNDYATETQPNGLMTFDGFHMFDADNLLETNYLTKMNDAFDNKNYDFFSSYCNSKNFGTSFISSYGSITLCYSFNINRGRPMASLGISQPYMGKGALFRNHLLAKGWKWCSLTEDNELSLELFSKGYRSTYCEAAKYYDEQPLTLKILIRQLMRWSRGGFVAFFKKCLPLIKGIFVPYDFSEKVERCDSSQKPAHKNGFFKTMLIETQKRLSCVDGFLTYFPTWLITFVFGLLYPLGALAYNAFADGSYNLTPMLNTLLIYYSTIYFNSLLLNLITVLREHRQIRINPIKLFFFMFAWPLISILISYTNFIAIFYNVKWKPIPHVIDKKIEDIYKEDTLAEFMYQSKQVK